MVILADDLGYADLGCYGSEIETPVLDKLAAGGLRFTQFYNTARCWPTRSALLTGYYPQQIRRDAMPGYPGGGQGVRPAWAKLLPEQLKPLGYRSYHSGKWHVDGPRLKGGFDRSYSLEDHDRYFAPKNHFIDDMKQPPVDPANPKYVTDAIADHTLDCLKDHAANHKDRPFFAYVAFTSPHFPLQAPNEDVARYRERYRSGWEAARKKRYERQRAAGLVTTPLSSVELEVGPPYHFPEALEKLGPGEVNRPVAWDSLTDEQRKFQVDKMAIHAAMIDRMDRQIGRIVEQLKAMESLEDTLLMFLSDNGASAEIMVRGDGHDRQAEPGSAATFLCLGPGWSSVGNTPFRRHKTWVHEGGISTPLIVHWPKGIADRGQLRHTPGHVVDLVPTILAVASSGAQAPAPADKAARTEPPAGAPPRPGRDLTPAFQADGKVQRDLIWWLHEGNRAVRVGDWKLVAAGANSPWELYDLATDRAEVNNLAATKPDKVKELEAAWQATLTAFQTQAATDAKSQPQKGAKK